MFRHSKEGSDALENLLNVINRGIEEDRERVRKNGVWGAKWSHPWESIQITPASFRYSIGRRGEIFPGEPFQVGAGHPVHAGTAPIREEACVLKVGIGILQPRDHRYSIEDEK